MQNEYKMAKTATELLYNDPSRRFVAGMTIEDDILRLWQFSRSHISVSTSIDIHQVGNEYIRTCASIS